MDGRTVKIGLHTITWIFFLILPIYNFPNILVHFEYDSCHLYNYLLISGMLVSLFYFNYNFAVPNYYFKQNYFAFIGAHLAFIIGVFILVIFFNKLYGPCVNPVQEDSNRNALRFFLARHLVVLIASLLMRINERLKSIDAQKTKTELQLLRAQINPHFLFNVLNTIYGQAIIKSDQTANSIAKLSELMRYSLEEGNVSKVTLDKEIDYLESYVSLQKLRLSNKTKVDLQIIGSAKKIQLPPMLFIPFVENAFKYGVSNEVETSIKIIIEVEGKQINLLVENTKLPLREKVKGSNQIGIKNVKNRLDLIYGNRYTLDISDSEIDYRVQLKILT